MSNQPETNETPATGYTPAPRKVGLPRFFELLGRDLWPLYKSSILCVAGFLPGTALAILGMMGGSALLTVAGGVPGALLGLFVGSWGWMLRAQALAGNTSTALWVASLAGIFVCTGFFSWLLAQVPLVDLPLPQLAKNAGLMFFGFFPRTLAAALVLAVYWGLTLLYLPATILVIVVFGFWLPVTVAGMILYPGLDKVFKLEETLAARRDAEIEERMEQNRPNFDH